MIEDVVRSFRFSRERERAGAQARRNTQQRMGIVQRKIAETSYETSRQTKVLKDKLENIYNPAESISAWADELDVLREETMVSRNTENRSGRRAPTFNATSKIEDPSFIQAVEDLSAKYNIDPSEVYKVIQGESSFNPRAKNPSGATGLFQFMPATARELGTTTDAILSMTPTEQVALYDKYLSRWKYDGSNRLGVMQAAPAYASRGPEEVIYPVGSPAWKQNPGWRSSGNGPITVRSINAYYERA